MTIEPSYRIVEDDPEFREYRDLTENKYQPLPDGVMRWYSNQHHSYATPDGYLVPDTRLQAIADAWKAYRESGGIRYDPTFEAVASALITAFEGEQP